MNFEAMKQMHLDTLQSLKEELASTRAIAKEHVKLYLRIIGALKGIAHTDPIDWSEYPTADEVQELLGDLNSKKHELASAKIVARLYGVELE